MTYRYRVDDQRDLALRAGCWAMVFEGSQARACRVTNPAIDASGTIEVAVDGAARRVALRDLVAPPRPLPFAPEPNALRAAIVRG